MRVGDVLEWLAAGVLSAATGIATGRAWPALLVVGVSLVYFAQCHGTTEFPKVTIPKVRLPRLRREGGDA